MDMDELNVFYSSVNSSYFGYNLDGAMGKIFDVYKCPSAVDDDASLTYVQNCSSTFLVNEQWGRSAVTLSPPYPVDDYYFPNATDAPSGEPLSIMGWNVPGINKEPEYYYYSQFHYKPFSGAQNPPALDAWQVGNMTDNRYNYYGIGNTYNAKMLYFYYIQNNYQNVKPYISSTMVAWDLSSAQKVYAVLGCMDWLIQDFVLEGLTSTYTLNEMVFGWSSGLVSNLTYTQETEYTSRHYKNGDAMYYARTITPFIQGNSWSGSSSNNHVSVNTGNLYPILTGRIMQMNDYEYPNIQMNVNNGLGSTVNLPYRCSRANFTVDNVYTW